jgi:hypothetical protein
MKKVFSTIFVLSLMLVIATGCKQQRDFLADAKSGYTDAVGFGEDNNTITSLTIDASVTSLKQALNAYLSSQKTYGQAIAVTVEANSSIVDDYNTANGTAYDVMPAAAYTLPSSINIPANSKEGLGEVNFDIATMITYGSSFALGVEITQVSGGPNAVLTAHSKHVFIIQVKNKYDGVYEVNGTFVDYSNPAFEGAYPLEWELVTTGPKQCVVYDAADFASPTPAYIFWTGTGYSYFGSFGLIVNFDDNDNIVSVTNYYGQPSSNGRSATLDPSGINKWDPATGNIDISYWLDQPSVITPHRGSMVETWSYSGPR